MKNEEFSKLVAQTPARNDGKSKRLSAAKEPTKDGVVIGGPPDDTDTIVRRELARDANERRKLKNERKRYEEGKVPEKKGKGKGKGKDKEKETAEEAGEEKGEQYRDRAAERRREDRTITEEDEMGRMANEMSAEDSKFLGGDIEHTHLVKGLDFALLHKLRTELQTETAVDSIEASHDQAEIKPHRDAAAVRPRTALARRILAAVALYERKQKEKEELLRSSSHVVERFLPSRSTYFFDVKNDRLEFSDQVPTNIQRSRADCKALAATMEVKVDSETEQKIHKVMTYVRAGTGRKIAMRKKTRWTGKGGPDPTGIKLVGSLKPKEEPKVERVRQAAEHSMEGREEVVQHVNGKENVEDKEENDGVIDMFAGVGKKSSRSQAGSKLQTESIPGGYFGNFVRRSVSTTRADLAKDLIKDVMEEEMVETEMIGPPRPPPVEEEELIEGAGEVLELSEEVFEAMEEKQSERTTETIVATVPPRFQSKDSKASVLLRRHGDSVKKRSIPIALQDDPNDRKKQKKS